MPTQAPKPAVGFKAAAPNALTIARVAMVAVVVAACAQVDLSATPNAAAIAAAAIFILAALTDALDGCLARKWHAISIFGRVMDPLADKLLVLATFVCLASPTFRHPTGDAQATAVEAWMVVVILARELLVTSLRGVFEARGVDFSASVTGKLKMIGQSAGAPALLLIAGLAAPAPTDPWGYAAAAIAWGVTLITAASALPYVAKAARAAGRTQQEQPK